MARTAYDVIIRPIISEQSMFEIAGVGDDAAKEALRLASHKLPIKTKIVKKGEETEKVGE